MINCKHKAKEKKKTIDGVCYNVYHHKCRKFGGYCIGEDKCTFYNNNLSVFGVTNGF